MTMIALRCQLAAPAAITVASPAHRFLSIFRLNTTAGVAQPQFDSDYYYDDSQRCEPSGNLLGTAAMAETERSVPRRGVQWAFIGYPRVKKRVYAETLSKLLKVPYFSMASLVRQELNPGTALYKQIANAVNRGQLVPEDIVFGLLSKRLEDGYHKGETGFILDGIPRSKFQAEILDEFVNIDLVVNFKSADGLVNHQEVNSTESSTVIAEDAWKDKLQAYVERSKPLEDYYRKRKKLLDFQVQNASGETLQGLLAALHLQHINAVCCSKKLTSGSS